MDGMTALVLCCIWLLECPVFLKVLKEIRDELKRFNDREEKRGM